MKGGDRRNLHKTLIASAAVLHYDETLEEAFLLREKKTDPPPRPRLRWRKIVSVSETTGDDTDESESPAAKESSIESSAVGFEGTKASYASIAAVDLEETDSSVDAEDNVKAEESSASRRAGAGEECSEVFVKKKCCGIPILMARSSSGKAGGDTASMCLSSGPAGRTRSRFRTSVSERLKKLGTVSKPLCLDDDEQAAEADSGLSCVDTLDQNKRSTSAYREEKKRKRARPDSDLGSGYRMNVDGGRRGRGKGRGRAVSASERRKAVMSVQDDTLFKILEDVVWNDEKKIPKEVVEKKSRFESLGNLLQPIFCFEDENLELVEKSEHEKEMDELWVDLDSALDANNVLIYHGDEGPKDETIKAEAETESDCFSYCPGGKHQFVLDEQIGIRCEFCSSVEVHIRDIMPPWDLALLNTGSMRAG